MSFVAHGPAGKAPRRMRVVIVTLTMLGVLLAVPDSASASVSATPDVSASVTGTVFAMARIGDRTIIAGDFSAVGGVARRNAAAIRADGTLDPTFKPNPNGIVYAVAVSADGARVFLGGAFSRAGGVSRSRLAAVDATSGKAITSWYAGTNDEVLALAVSGHWLYAGGKFTTLGGVARRRLASVDTTTRLVQPYFNPASDWTVRAVAPSADGTTVYAAGGFTTIGGAPRPGVAQLTTSTGAATGFAPTRGGTALAVAFTPNGRYLFVSTTSNKLFAYRPAVSNAPLYKWSLDGDVQAIAASSAEVYLGGHFDHATRGATSAPRHHVASITVRGALTPWAPAADGTMGVWSAVAGPTNLSVGGDFLHIGGATQPGFARFAGTP
jgi:hypothetical protein